MKIKCYSVRLKSLTEISDKAYRAESWDGSEDILPKSQVFGCDYDVSKSQAYWIAAWILDKKNIQFSYHKKGWYNPNTAKVEPHYDIVIENHIPERIEPTKKNPDESLIR